MKSIIMIPGYKGSNLKNAVTGERVWLKSRLLFGGKESIALPLSSREKVEKNLVEDGIISGLNVLGVLKLMDIYGMFIEKLRYLGKNSYAVKVFSYDWRKSIIENAQKLHVFINELKKNGSTEINIISHSMGAVITDYYLRYGTKDPFSAKGTWPNTEGIRKVVLCAGPFRGTVRALEYTQIGNPLLINKKILCPITTLSFPSAYQMLPSYRENIVEYINSDERIDLFSPEGWEKNRLGFFRYPEYAGRINEVKEFVKNNLEIGKKIAELVVTPAEKEPPRDLKILNLHSTSKKTPDKFLLRKTVGNPEFVKSRKEANEDPEKAKDMKVPGDGLVSNVSGIHPLQNTCENIEDINAPFGHKTVFNNKKASSLMYDFILS